MINTIKEITISMCPLTLSLMTVVFLRLAIIADQWANNHELTKKGEEK